MKIVNVQLIRMCLLKLQRPEERLEGIIIILYTPYWHNVIYRSFSERTPHPLVSHDQGEEVCPYSSINEQMQSDHVGTSNSMLFHHQDRYTKLGVATEQQSHSHSMYDLSSSPSSPDNHKEWMSQIKQDLEPFSQPSSSSGQGGGSRVQSATNTGKVSSRWSQFMCEVDKKTTPTLQEKEESLGWRGSGPAAHKVGKSTS